MALEALPGPLARPRHDRSVVEPEPEVVRLVVDRGAHVIRRYGVVGRPQRKLGVLPAPSGRRVLNSICVDGVVPDLGPRLEIHHQRHFLLLDVRSEDFPERAGLQVMGVLASGTIAKPVAVVVGHVLGVTDRKEALLVAVFGRLGSFSRMAAAAQA